MLTDQNPDKYTFNVPSKLSNDRTSHFCCLCWSNFCTCLFLLMAGAGGYLIVLGNEQDDDRLWDIGLGLALSFGVIAPTCLGWYLYQAYIWPDFQTKNWFPLEKQTRYWRKQQRRNQFSLKKWNAITQFIVETLLDKFLH